MIQDRLLYYPERQSLAAAVADARRGGFAPWPAESAFFGWIKEPPGVARATVVLFHGNAGHAGHRQWYGDLLVSLDLRLILAEYPGYGPRDGVPGEAALVADAAEILKRVRAQFPGPLLLAGESLGAGVAAAVAVQGDAAALLLITPWDRLDQVARHHYPWLPVGLLLRDRYDSVAHLSRYRGRTAVIVAADDDIVPAQGSRALFESLGSAKRLWSIPAAGHNDWMMHVDAAWWRAVVAFLLEGRAGTLEPAEKR